MTSALGSSTRVFHTNNQAFETLVKDVEKLYSKDEIRSDQKYEAIYPFVDNEVSIVFKRVWQAPAAPIDMLGSAEVVMQKRDASLEGRIKEIIEKPNYQTVGGIFSVVNPITFSLFSTQISSPL